MDGFKSKRIQVKNACVNCQRSCKKCDDARPCQRCARYGLGDSCVDSKRKPRQRGIKRGPYKKRNKNKENDAITATATTAAAEESSWSSLPPIVASRPVVDKSDREESPLGILSDVALTSRNSNNNNTLHQYHHPYRHENINIGGSPKHSSLLSSSRIGVFHSRSIPISAARFDTKYNASNSRQQSIQN